MDGNGWEWIWIMEYEWKFLSGQDEVGIEGARSTKDEVGRRELYGRV